MVNILSWIVPAATWYPPPTWSSNPGMGGKGWPWRSSSLSPAVRPCPSSACTWCPKHRVLFCFVLFSLLPFFCKLYLWQHWHRSDHQTFGMLEDGGAVELSTAPSTSLVDGGCSVSTHWGSELKQSDANYSTKANRRQMACTVYTCRDTITRETQGEYSDILDFKDKISNIIILSFC